MINNKVLALKYRPQEFKDLIGQEVAATTITNAIELGKTPNAYLLTGIRGVGKTTTARLIAKSLNCEKNIDKSKNCSSDKFCETCQEIIKSNHIDILEMDAASKTGIDDVRELIENSKYSPTSAQFKIFIIDEVHMLSKQAFNGLLKTLEEPPTRLKFILATTEVRKIPVTILSRCQRFDLKRVSLDKLLLHLQNISKKENGNITTDALRLIARASEGSVRDAISLLDRALISRIDNKKNKINDIEIREMLGLADKSKLISLFKDILLGKQNSAVSKLRELINNGLDAKNFLNDILEIIYLFTRRINLGPIEKDMMISETELKLIDEHTKNLDVHDLGLFWHLTIKTIDDLKIVSNENQTLEMFIIQLIHLKNIEHENNEKSNINANEISADNKYVSEKINIDSDKKKITSPATNQLKNTNQIKEDLMKRPELEKKLLVKNQINNFEELVDFAHRNKEVELKYDLERNVRLVSFNKGKIDISFNEKLNKSFIKNLTDKLLIWTGERWVISLSKEKGAKTLYDKRIENKSLTLINEQESEVTKKIISTFPDAKLIDVKKDDDA